jgi:hypothetical protein
MTRSITSIFRSITEHMKFPFSASATVRFCTFRVSLVLMHRTDELRDTLNRDLADRNAWNLPLNYLDFLHSWQASGGNVSWCFVVS